ASGVEQGRRGETEGFRNLLFKLHSSLGLDDTGKAILASIALVYLFMLVTGAVLWWPRRWPPVLSIQLHKGLLRGLFDLHRTGGAVMGVLIAVSVASGAYMAWRPLGDVVTALAGSAPVKAPKLPKLSPIEAAAPDADALLATARAAIPGAPVFVLSLPAKDDRPVRVRFKLADDPHPNGLSSVWLDPRDGRVLAVNRWQALDPGARAVAVVYPLHTGELGGVALEALVSLNGLALALLAVSGIWLWWKRRRMRLASAASKPA
ncbi:MAG: PepSY-associated TM helix domain-containing protein, partial [Massilia sp.]